MIRIDRIRTPTDLVPKIDRLFDLRVEYYGKLDEPARRRFPIQPIYFLAPRYHS